MSLVEWVFAILGWIIGLGIILLVSFDVRQVRNDGETVSEWCLTMSVRHPWFPILFTGTICLAIGLVLGHLFLAQRVHHHEDSAVDTSKAARPDRR